MRLESGKVKFFDRNRLFGFLILQSGEEIFFHWKGFQLLFADDGDRFNFCDGAYDHASRRPQNDELIYFERSADSKGRSQANPWCYKENYTSALAEKALRTKYRVLKQLTYYGGAPRPRPEVLWEGTNLAKLATQYPRTGDPEGDPFFPSSYGKGFERRIWFEVMSGGFWKPCDDPRRVEARYWVAVYFGPLAGSYGAPYPGMPAHAGLSHQ